MPDAFGLWPAHLRPWVLRGLLADVDTLFWLGSTTAQSVVALLAFGAFLGVWRLDQFTRSLREEIEQAVFHPILDWVGPWTHDAVAELVRAGLHTRTPPVAEPLRNMGNILSDAEQIVSLRAEALALESVPDSEAACFDALERQVAFLHPVVRRTRTILRLLAVASLFGLATFLVSIYVVLYGRFLATHIDLAMCALFLLGGSCLVTVACLGCLAAACFSPVRHPPPQKLSEASE